MIRIVNPETGAEVFGPAHGNTVTVVETVHAQAPDVDKVRVKISPSFRPGMPYDIGIYESTWVRPIDDNQLENALLALGFSESSSGWLDRDNVRVAIDVESVDLFKFAGRPGWSGVEWNVGFGPGTPSTVILAAVREAMAR